MRHYQGAWGTGCTLRWNRSRFTVASSQILLVPRQKQRTNAAYRKQYVNAFLEAEAAEATHVRRLALASSFHEDGGPAGASFGSWRVRETSGCWSAAHCVCEGRTPHSWSVESISSSMPSGLIRSIDRTIQQMAACPPALSCELCTAYDAILREVSLASLELPLTSYFTYRIALAHGWRGSTSLLKHVLRSLPRLCSLQAVSQLIGIAADGVRIGLPLHAPPSIEEVKQLLDLALQASGSSQLLPATAAPVLSILYRESSSHGLAGDVLDLAEHYFIQRSQDSRSLRYLPAVAWGELIRATSRCGASLEEIQLLVDTITDSRAVKHAEKLLQSTHLWSAYLSCSPPDHALSVYAQREEYGVKDDPRLLASLMQSLLQGYEKQPCSTYYLKEAEKGWLKLLTLEEQSSAIICVKSVLEAYISLCVAKNDMESLLSFAVGFDRFLRYWGVSREFWELNGGPALLQDTGRIYKEQGGSPFLMFLDACADAFFCTIPPSVTGRFKEAIRHLSVAKTEGKESFLLTEDLLFELLQ